MLIVSIAAWETEARPTAAVATISAKSSSRRAVVQRLRIGEAGGHPPEVEDDRRRDTGPASGPRPTSSSPAMQVCPARASRALRGRLQAGRPVGLAGANWCIHPASESQVLGPLSPS